LQSERGYLTYGNEERNVNFEIVTCYHKQRLNIQWNKHQRIYGCLIHIDIRDGKLWIQYDGTENGVANDLVALGVPPEDIVLAFQSAYMRQYSEFAID